ncbi:MAG: paraquat-inducible protein A [Deltaproteobacteria bacterium]|nr:paraquat-inducible protein A [Deltaproteobacteria bacterium]
MSAAIQTARSRSLANCHECGLLTPLAVGAHGAACPRCASQLHFRKADSLRRCAALLLAAVILYIPANVLPIMTITSFGKDQSDTIMSGVIYLFSHGMWPLALVVFVASVLVPGLKMVILGYLLYSVQTGSRWRPAERTRLYRITEAVGRWSMVDIYVVTILVALVHVGQLANIRAEAGALFFGAVVILTILAAESFDPRLIWDRADERSGERNG